jgi:hypothetical protein
MLWRSFGFGRSLRRRHSFCVPVGVRLVDGFSENSWARTSIAIHFEPSDAFTVMLFTSVRSFVESSNSTPAITFPAKNPEKK